MHILVIGGSGRTGKLVLDELQLQGYEITTLVRDPAALEGYNVNIVQGTPTKLEDVRAAFQSHIPDAVIVTLNAPRASDSPFAAPISPPRLMADCNANIVSAMKEFGVQKIVILQAFGVGTSWDNMPCMLQLLMSKSNMRYQYDDHNHTDREVRESGVNFVFVRPARLVESTNVTEVRDWPNEGKGMSLMASCSRKSVAHFLVMAATQKTWDGQAPVITN
ncbi:TrkA-N domain dehydrogenase [Penicillium malachiteum]|nr:TrkA-N domain dehydrogenase [Penicillium malachiteum]